MMAKESDNISLALELFQQAKTGDSQAFGRLYEMYFTPVYRFIWLRVREKELADDLAQTVFLKVYEAISQVKDKAGSPLAYFFTVARNTVIDHWRKKKEVLIRQEEDVWINIPDKAPGPAEQLGRKESANRVLESLDHLSDDQREIIILKFINQLSNKEISELTQRTEDAIRQTQCRALKSLRQIIKSYGE